MRSLILRLPVFLLALALNPLTARAGDTHGKPILEQETLHAIPGSFAEMWSEADLVARVKIAYSEVVGLKSPHTVRVITVHHADLLNVLKGNAKAGSEVMLIQVAGQLETDEAIIRVADEEPLEPGEYIVFARHVPNDTRLQLVGDVDGAYKIVNGFIEPKGRFTSFSKAHRGLSEERFLREIETVAARAGRVR